MRQSHVTRVAQLELCVNVETDHEADVGLVRDLAISFSTCLDQLQNLQHELVLQVQFSCRQLGYSLNVPLDLCRARCSPVPHQQMCSWLSVKPSPGASKHVNVCNGCILTDALPALCVFTCSGQTSFPGALTVRHAYCVRMRACPGTLPLTVLNSA